MKAGHYRLASPTTALAVGGLSAVLAIAMVPLYRADPASGFSAEFGPLTIWVAFATVGVLVASRQPRNVMGWILLGTGFLGILNLASTLYEFLVYRRGDSGLPLGTVSIFLEQGWPAIYLLLLPLSVFLFPDGRMPSRRWRWVLWSYLAASGTFLAIIFAMTTTAVIDDNIHVTSDGDLEAVAHPTGSWAWAGTLEGILVAFLAVCWIVFIARQVIAWRRAIDTQRQQLKLLLAGATISIAGLVLSLNGSGGTFGGIGGAAILALPVSFGVAILRYRLYEIDRLVSRTISYAILTGSLVAVYLGVVTITTRALPLSSPVGVAASTLAAAALFNPLRTRIQRLVDRRFNRARYDADATVAGFTAHLRDAIDLDTVQHVLVDVVSRSVEPAHASLWIRGPGHRTE